jgi:hypothetical protein
MELLPQLPASFGVVLEGLLSNPQNLGRTKETSNGAFGDVKSGRRHGSYQRRALNVDAKPNSGKQSLSLAAMTSILAVFGRVPSALSTTFTSRATCAGAAFVSLGWFFLNNCAGRTPRAEHFVWE